MSLYALAYAASGPLIMFCAWCFIAAMRESKRLHEADNDTSTTSTTSTTTTQL